jgi:hypothetical protein
MNSIKPTSENQLQATVATTVAQLLDRAYAVAACLASDSVDEDHAAYVRDFAVPDMRDLEKSLKTATDFMAVPEIREILKRAALQVPDTVINGTHAHLAAVSYSQRVWSDICRTIWTVAEGTRGKPIPNFGVLAAAGPVSLAPSIGWSPSDDDLVSYYPLLVQQFEKSEWPEPLALRAQVWIEAMLACSFANEALPRQIDPDDQSSGAETNLSVSLSPKESKVLRFLAGQHPLRQFLVNIQVGIRVNRKTLQPIVNQLIEKRLAYRPNGIRQGIAITGLGLASIKKLTLSSKLGA